MELITLGTSAAYPTVNRACSGYLIRNNGTGILVDAGSGVTRNLMRWISPLLLDAIIISHLHQDHFIDLYPLYYFLVFHRAWNLPLDVYAPEGAQDFILRIFSPGSENGLDAVYNFKPLKHRGFFKIGDIECQSIGVRHGLPGFGVRISGRRLISYSSDTGFDEVLYDIASGSDVFICEATMQQEQKDLLHLTAAQAGSIAREAGVKKLVLTHIWPDFEPVESLRMAAEQYDGPIIIAEDNMQILLE
ncbi:MAG: MBL fold metallo-hydrolase [Actinobacteria bacterium]|nr:MBL fold metallo-hydrolase [Actinomycetota bacterium]